MSRALEHQGKTLEGDMFIAVVDVSGHGIVNKPSL